MGWYTIGAGGLEYKYGDVVALARSSGLGMLEVVPRVLAADSTGEWREVDDLEFLGSLQTAIEGSGMSWRHIDFTEDGESIQVALDFDPVRTMAGLAEQVAHCADSVRSAYRAAAPEAPEVSELKLAMDCT